MLKNSRGHGLAGVLTARASRVAPTQWMSDKPSDEVKPPTLAVNGRLEFRRLRT